MTAENPFVFSPDHYANNCRDLNVMKNYARDAAFYLRRRTGRDFDECFEFVTRRVSPSHPQGMKDPDVLVLTRKDNGDRVKETPKLSEFILDVAQKNRIMSPTMAVYLGPEEKESVLAGFIGRNIDRRNESKGEMFAAKESGDEALEEYKKNEQKSFKISNNSLSGAHASNSTILYNKSTHSTLTSTCRTATSYGNINNEKFLCGNRHYWSPEIVKANITCVCRAIKPDIIDSVMAKYGIVYPTTEQTMEVIRYSTDLYWRNEGEIETIRLLVDSLMPVERAAFVYMGDMHHLAKFNDGLVRDFIDRLSTKATQPIDNPQEPLAAADDDLEALACLLCAEELKGTTLKQLKVDSPEKYGIVGATVQQILDLIQEFKPLIQAFWRVDVLPPSVAHVRSSIRRGVVTSDTDSTIFTVQDWTRWSVGKLDFSEKSKAVSYAVVYLVTQTIAHTLALASGGMGVREKDIHTLSMKNEFAFPVFVLTTMAKHYFAYISAQEGVVYDKLDTEVKGVYLKDSNAPPHVMKEFNDSLIWVMDQILEKGSLSVELLLDKVARIETEVSDSIRQGSPYYLTGGQIKEKTTYSKPESSPYAYYDLWQQVFADKYGNAPQLPYQAVKVSVDLNNQTMIRAWLNRLVDQDIAQRMNIWLTERKKTNLTTMMLPKAIVEVSGIPEEILDAMDLRKLVYATVKPFYLLLESLGVYYINNNLTRLVSDQRGPKRLN